MCGVSVEEALELGRSLRILCRAISEATRTPDYNIVQNNGAAAAQVVNHVHFHIIPRPEIRASGRFSESFTMFGRGVRSELDGEEAIELARTIREAVVRITAENGECNGLATADPAPTSEGDGKMSAQGCRTKL